MAQTGSTTHKQPTTRISVPRGGLCITTTPIPPPQMYHVPLTFTLQGLLGVLLGDGEADRLRRLLTLSQIHPLSFFPLVVIPTSSSILPTNWWACPVGYMETRVLGSDRAGFSSSCGRTMQCKEERQLPELRPPPATSPPPPPSQLRSSAGADRKVVQNIIAAAEWA